MARWWLRSPLTIRALVALVGLVPFLLAMPYAMYGHPHDPFGGLTGLGGPIGVLIAARLREPEYWRLDKGSRRRVREVQLTGQPSGDGQVDSIALGRLSRSAEKAKANFIVLGVTLGVMIATPVVAALRTGYEWWLIASVPQVLCVPLWLRAPRREGAQARLDRLVDRIGSASSGG